MNQQQNNTDATSVGPDDGKRVAAPTASTPRKTGKSSAFHELVRTTRPHATAWYHAYVLAIRQPRGLTTRSWHVGENPDGVIFMATYRPMVGGAWAITLTPEEPAGSGLVQKHKHLRSSRVFRPQRTAESVRIVHRGGRNRPTGLSGFASRPVVGQDAERAREKVSVSVSASTSTSELTLV